MKSLKMAIGGVCACLIAGAQVPEVHPQVAGRAVQEGQVTVMYLAPRFATAIRMPDAVNSVVLGDPDSFTAEHSEREPQIVFVKPITAKAVQTNLLISTVHGYQANLLLISRGEATGTQPDVDFMMRYRPAGRFVIEPSAPSLSIAQTVALPTSGQMAEPPTIPSPATPSDVRPVAQNTDAALSFDCPSRIFGGGRFLRFVKRIHHRGGAAGIGQPSSFGGRGGWTDTPSPSSAVGRINSLLSSAA